MNKINDKIKAGMGLLISAILFGLVLQWFFQSWINEQSVESRWLIFIPLAVCCIAGAILMMKGVAEREFCYKGMVKK
jgi:hypothetical protein